ncbi:substrate-binding domain-containing protein [Siculibacillus lacustris]|nr:substrate-binding domain-containing protein [Siculibacillus lacustris]
MAARDVRWSATAAIGFALALFAGAASAETRFAVVAPVAGNAFYDAVGEGCRARAVARGGITCVLFGPGGEEKRNQGEIVAALVADKIDGLAVSPALISEVGPALTAARAAGIPVVAFDADLPGELRRSFIGTNARDFGRALGASLRRWKPAGGRFAVLTGAATTPSLADRVEGVRDALGSGWTEIAGSPVATTGEAREAAGLVDRLLLDHPDLDAVISVGAWPFLAEDAWREIARRHKERFDRARTVVVVADALPVERRLVRDGLGHVLVGQRPGDMGARIVDTLDALAHGRPAPEIVYVGFDVVTRADLIRTTD